MLNFVHSLCRCGYQFCYQCEVEWKNDQKTCSSGCLLTGHGYYDDYDYNEPEYDFEVDTCNYYSDEEGRRWPSYEEYIDQQMANPKMMLTFLFTPFFLKLALYCCI